MDVLPPLRHSQSLVDRVALRLAVVRFAGWRIAGGWVMLNARAVVQPSSRRVGCRWECILGVCVNDLRGEGVACMREKEKLKGRPAG